MAVPQRIPTPVVQQIPTELLTSRLRPPRARGARVLRPRLVHRVEAASDDPVMMVIAPAGYGKTTLLSQWAASREHAVGWISLSSSENDIAAFFAYLIAALRSVDPALTRIGGNAQLHEQNDLDQLVTNLLNDLAAAGERFALVLDDYHLIESPDVHAIVQALIDYAPEPFHLVISSRSEPPFPLARRRVLEQLTTITIDDLRFTLEETIAYCQLAGLKLTDEDVASLRERTGGWAAGIKMVALSIDAATPDAGDFLSRLGTTTQLLQDFLLEEVLEQQPPDVRTALLITSLFDRFNVDLYRAVVDDPAAAQAINAIVRANLFIVSIDANGDWYHYDHLFQAFLRRTAYDEIPDDVRVEAYRRATDWFESRGLIYDAIGLSISSRDWERAADLIRPLADASLKDEEFYPLFMWLRAMPPQLIHSDPAIAYLFAEAAIRAGHDGESETIIAMAEEAAEAGQDLLTLASLADMRAIRARFHDDGAAASHQAERLEQLLRQHDEENPSSVEADPVGSEQFATGRLARRLRLDLQVLSATTARLLGQTLTAERAAETARLEALLEDKPFCAATASLELGMALEQQGRLPEASQWFQSSLRLESIYPTDRRMAMLHLADIYRERGQLEDAQQVLEDCLALAHQMEVRTLLAQTRLVFARVAWDRGDEDAAIAYAEEAIAASSEFVSERLRREAHAVVVGIRLTHGDLGAALKWAHESRLAPDDEPDYARLREHLVYARALVAQGEPEDAISLLDRLLASAVADGRNGDVIAILILLATAYQDMVELDKAVAAINRALRLAEPGNYLRVFTTEGQPLARLLKVAQRRGAVSGYCQYVLTAMGEEQQQLTKLYHPELVEPITAREMEVLRLIAVGLTNREIANELFISVSTVKRHVTNLYGKLGVATRTKALQESRRLGLLTPPVTHG
ncbi:MAG TPA: LuxR C-terminal-related transcriptional regulator [Thermomicrobiales bacterium]|nr:LuxR C-terminal-related transcriptional regulator [Thermomicrobiales bacterium]